MRRLEPALTATTVRVTNEPIHHHTHPLAWPGLAGRIAASSSVFSNWCRVTWRATLVGTNGTAEDVANMRRTLGLDRPVYVQYVRFLGRLVHLDLGNSAVTRRPGDDGDRQPYPPTAELAVAALLIALVLGLVTGIISATMQYSVWDNLATLVSLIGISMPTFWLGLMLMLLFSVRLGWLPSTGSGSLAQLVLPALTLGSASRRSSLGRRARVCSRCCGRITSAPPTRKGWRGASCCCVMPCRTH